MRKAFTRQCSLVFPECFLALSYHFFSTSKGGILNELRVHFNKKNILIDKGDKIFDYDGSEIPVQVQKKEGDRVEHEMQEAEVLLLEVRVLRYLVILLMLL